MPLEIVVNFGNNKQQLEVVQIKGTKNIFKIKTTSEPINIVVDPNLWVLKILDFKKH